MFVNSHPLQSPLRSCDIARIWRLVKIRLVANIAKVDSQRYICLLERRPPKERVSPTVFRVEGERKIVGWSQ